MSEPSRDRPVMPDGYGVENASRYVEWADASERLRESHHYWIATTRPDGRPHVVPRWGVWLDGRLWYDGSPETVHARNLAENAHCVVHLESGAEAVIVEGRSVPSQPIVGDWGVALAQEFARKYRPAYEPEPDQWSDEAAGGMRYVQPTRAMAWTDFPNDLTRFTF